MFEKLEITAMAQAMAAHAGARLGVIARNVANADTPGYVTRDVRAFADVWREQGAEAMRATRPGHIDAGNGRVSTASAASAGHASPNGNSVSIEAEMVKMVETRQQNDMALAIARGTSDVIRASLGRR